jgi:hypothetical protein
MRASHEFTFPKGTNEVARKLPNHATSRQNFANKDCFDFDPRAPEGKEHYGFDQKQRPPITHEQSKNSKPGYFDKRAAQAAQI